MIALKYVDLFNRGDNVGSFMTLIAGLYYFLVTILDPNGLRHLFLCLTDYTPKKYLGQYLRRTDWRKNCFIVKSNKKNKTT